MDPATIAGSVITILSPYVSKMGEELTKTVGEVAVDKASKLLGWLKDKFDGDPSATKDLSRFEKDPKSFEVALKSTIEEKAQVCAGCHGANGVPTDKSWPVISGQQLGYLR